MKTDSFTFHIPRKTHLDDDEMTNSKVMSRSLITFTDIYSVNTFLFVLSAIPSHVFVSCDFSMMT